MSEPGKNIINDTILSSAQSGDNKQTEALIRQYRNVVEAIAVKYINSPLEYDDIIQEGMIGLLAAIKTFNNSKGAQFKTYAQTCINNSIQTALRKFNRQKDIPIGSVIEYAEEEIPEENGVISAEDYYIAGESVSMLANTLKENLSEYENEVLRLHIVGCNYSEIAKRLSKTPKSVDNALQRIKKKLSTVNLKTDNYN
mgnify:FL=1